MHSAMIQQVPAPFKFFVATSLESTDVHEHALSGRGQLLFFDLVVVFSKLLQVLDVVGGQQLVHDVSLLLGETASAESMFACISFLFDPTL